MNAQQYGNRPAFPHAAMTEQVTVPTQHPGMTVREEFAKAALTGLLANPFYAQQMAEEGITGGGDAADAALYHADRMCELLAKDGA